MSAFPDASALLTLMDTRAAANEAMWGELERARQADERLFTAAYVVVEASAVVQPPS